MQNRERGAAHINIYFFLVLLVVFFGTLWFGYLQMSQVNDAKTNQLRAEAAMQTAQRQNLQYEHYALAITQVVGEGGSWAGQPGFNYERPEYSRAAGTLKPLTGVSVPKDVKDLLENLAKKLSLTSSQATPLRPFLGLIDSGHKSNLAKVAQALADRTTAQIATTTLKKSADDRDAKSTADLQKERSTHSTLRTNLSRENARKDQRLQMAQASLKDSNVEKDELRTEHKVAIGVLDKRHDRDQGQLSSMTALVAMINPPDQADGAVISASMKANVGWIDIGRKDMLLRGTKFRITNPAGTKIKGHGEVITLKQDTAEIRLTSVIDKIGDPIARGDKIYNPLYGPNVKRKIALIGRFSFPYTKPAVTKILKDLGNEVFDKVQVGIDLVIVGLRDQNDAGDGLKPVEEIPGYKQAQSLRCEIITIQKIRDLLKLGE